MSKKLLLAASIAVILNASPAMAAGDDDLKALRAEIEAMRTAYETKIEQLEGKVEKLEARQNKTAAVLAQTEPAAGGEKARPAATPATDRKRTADNSFNPEIGVILHGKYQSFSSDESEFAGFAVSEEGERGKEGLGIDETELNFSASVDDKFRGSTTIALHEHDGETEVEIEEAYVETMALPYGLHAKAGRFFAELGYLNSHHGHSDDFADRPLPSRAFLDGNYGDDGLQLSAILPTMLYTEIGGGLYRGDDFPGGGADGSDIGAWTAYGRIGGDIGMNTSWRLGASTLQTEGVERSANEDEVIFDGDSQLYIADARMVYAPTGNNAEQELILQGEYFYRDEDGTYDDQNAGSGAVIYDGHQSGWYIQGVYKFHPQWRVGTRYSRLYAGGVPAGLTGTALDNEDHDPQAAAVMLDWTNSEFSRARIQYNREELADGQDDNQIILQYIMSIGAHGAHPY